MRTVLVTGATRGIGREVVRQLAGSWRVIVGGRDAEAVAALVAQCPEAVGFVADLADEQQVAAAVEGLGLERLDAVVHSAGVVAHGPVDATPRGEWRRVMELNVVAVADLTARLLPALRSARGQVVVINSGSGFTASPSSSVYAASKFALRAFTDALRAEERGRVRVSSIHPGRVDTDMQHELRAAEGGEYEAEQYLTVEAVARAVVAALEAPEGASHDVVSVRPSGL